MAQRILHMLILIESFIFFCPKLVAKHVSFGLSSVEEGDDRLRPAVSLNLGAKKFESQLTYLGRRFVGVTERTGLVTGSHLFSVPFMRGFYGMAGLGFLANYTKIEGFFDSKKIKSSKIRYNLGIHLGAKWKYLLRRRWFFSAAWSSVYFPAGIAGLYLATGRKQVISCSFGVAL